MIVGILQPSYLPWLGFFEQIRKSDIFVLYDDVQFEKGSWRNRNKIKTHQGVQWLTIPVKKNGVQLIKDVRIDYSVPWKEKHIKTIKQNYSKAKYFNQYSESLFNIIRTDNQSLSFLCEQIIRLICSILKIDTEIICSSELNLKGKGTERLIRIIKHLDGDVFYEGAAGRNYIDIQYFSNNGVHIIFQDYMHPVYNQLYGEFIPFLSIIDLIFNHGEKSLELI
jgi:hypothetical protein